LGSVKLHHESGSGTVGDDPPHDGGIGFHSDLGRGAS
jgi:hypothetical protein